MTALWTRQAALDATGGSAHGPDWTATGVSIDTRTIAEGDLFVALKDVRDGHDFVASALEIAAAALVRRDADLDSPPAERALVRVGDPLIAYHELARRERREKSWRVAAVTGSVGKTTTKDFLAFVLATDNRVGASGGNRNSTLGLPAQLLRQPDAVEVFVAEAGMSRPGELDLLGDLLRPTRLLYTRLAAVHTEFFDDGFAGVVRAKADLGSAPGLAVSGKTGDGVADLIGIISDRLAGKVARVGTAMRERHRVALLRAVAQLAAAEEALAADHGMTDLIAEELRSAIRAVDSIVGRIDVENVLDEIFASFCIGK